MIFAISIVMAQIQLIRNRNSPHTSLVCGPNEKSLSLFTYLCVPGWLYRAAWQTYRPE